MPEAKVIVDNTPHIIYVEKDNVTIFLEKLLALGANATRSSDNTVETYLLQHKHNTTNDATDIITPSSPSEVLKCKLCNKEYNQSTPISYVCPDCLEKIYAGNRRLINFNINNRIDFSNSSRSVSITALTEIKTLCTIIFEKFSIIDNLEQDIHNETEKSKDAGGVSTFSACLSLFPPLIIFIWRWIVGTFLGGIICGVIAFFAFCFISNFIDKIFYVGSDEYNNKILKYKHENVEPLIGILTLHTNALTVFKNNESFIWALNAIGEEYFDPDIIDCFIEYLQKQRADSLKEAKNLFKEELYRARMEQRQEEMLAAARNTERAALNTEKAALSTERAARITANQARKQTAIQRSIYRQIKK